MRDSCTSRPPQRQAADPLKSPEHFHLYKIYRPDKDLYIEEERGVMDDARHCVLRELDYTTSQPDVVFSHLFRFLTNLLVGWKRCLRLLDTECFLVFNGGLHCSKHTGSKLLPFNFNLKIQKVAD